MISFNILVKKTFLRYCPATTRRRPLRGAGGNHFALSLSPSSFPLCLITCTTLCQSRRPSHSGRPTFLSALFSLWSDSSFVGQLLTVLKLMANPGTPVLVGVGIPSTTQAVLFWVPSFT